jgi:hypothetical protein
MEGRNLPSGNITLSWGQIILNAPAAANNSAYVWYDGNNVDVRMDGEFAQFDRSQVYWVNYNGSPGGGDHFQNDTSLNSSITVNNGNNTVLGGSSYNYVTLWGDHNTYDARGGASNVYAYGGPNDNVVPYGNVYVTAYNNITTGFSDRPSTPAPPSSTTQGGPAAPPLASAPPATPPAPAPWRGWAQWQGGWVQFAPR